MTRRRHASAYQRPADPYAFARCSCGHLVYADSALGDPCRFCPCTAHIPAEEVTTDAAPTPRPEGHDAARTPDAAS